MKAPFAIPGPVWGPYPERSLHGTSPLDPPGRTVRRFRPRVQFAHERYRGFVDRVRTLAWAPQAPRTPENLARLSGMLLRGFDTPTLALAFATIGAAMHEKRMQAPYDCQWLAARVLLDGGLAEMQTGEGKTLAIGLAACTAALAGIPVHVLTANDYLVERDSAWLLPVAETLGLTVAHVLASDSPSQRRRAYQANIVYVTAKELVFDYLRDRVTFGSAQNELERRLANAMQHKLALRGLPFAIVDEADSILIDEAQSPLILAQPGGGTDVAMLRRALEETAALVEGEDFVLDHSSMRAQLTEAGKRHYLVKEDAIQIVDPHTGRVSHGRAWSRGLHQLIELKEGVTVTQEHEPLARLTYQTFFPRYHWLSGTSGTLSEAASELWRVYRLPVVKIAPREENRRSDTPPHLYGRAQDKWRAVVNACAYTHATGRPILIGTASVAESQMLSSLLTQAGLAHTVLNARQDEEEAHIVEQAGALHAITIATNMAGRGTDISLQRQARAQGGLHVIAAHLNDSPRIDRQLSGRAARQGDPGSATAFFSLEDVIFQKTLPTALRVLAARCWRDGLPTVLARFLAYFAQARQTWRASRARKQLQKQDEAWNRRFGSGM